MIINRFVIILAVLISISININMHAQQDEKSFVDNDSIERYLDSPIYIKKQFEIQESEVIKRVDALPAFGVYQDVFFTSGIPLNKSINRNTADVMFQLSVRQRLTKSSLPFQSFLFLTYTQKSFWDIYAESAPFRDTNYNPSIGVGRYVIQNNKLVGAAFFQFEHESNGRENEYSRSWNSISFSGKYFFNTRLSFSYKIWLPIVDGKNNRNLTDYRGFFISGIDFMSRDKKWWVSADFNPRKGWGNANTTFNIAYKISNRHNQYLYGRFYNGRGDSLLDYKEYDLNFRIGMCIKPDFYSIF